jgi:putative membrane protein
MYGWHDWEWSLGGSLVMGLGMLFMWAVPIGLIAALVIYLNNQNKLTKPPEKGIDILENAYARGEISRDEFIQKRDDLLGKKSPD